MTSPPLDDEGDATLTPARQLLLRALSGVLGLTAPDPRYLRLIAPGDTPGAEAQWAKESDCMLVALGVEELVYVLPVRGPYVGGSAPELIEKRAGGSPMFPNGAVRLPTLEAPPQAGDLLWYGQSPAAPFEHVEHVTGVRWPGPATLSEALHMNALVSMQVNCVAGGERTPAGLETVEAVTRTLVWNGHAYVDHGTGRPVIGVVDADLLAERYPLRDAST